MSIEEFREEQTLAQILVSLPGKSREVTAKQGVLEMGSRYGHADVTTTDAFLGWAKGC
jgi:hypothetical protein